MKIKILNQTTDKHTKCGDTVFKVEILDSKKRKFGYIKSGVTCTGIVKEIEDNEVYKTQSEAFKS